MIVKYRLLSGDLIDNCSLTDKQLRRNHAELAARHEQLSAEHASTVERSKLYDRDMRDKARRIREEKITGAPR